MGQNIEDAAQPFTLVTPDGLPAPAPAPAPESIQNPNDNHPTNTNPAARGEYSPRWLPEPHAALSGATGAVAATNASWGTSTSPLNAAQLPPSAESFATTSPSALTSGNTNQAATSTTSDEVDLTPLIRWLDSQRDPVSEYQSTPPHPRPQTVNPFGRNHHDVQNSFRSNPFTFPNPDPQRYRPAVHPSQTSIAQQSPSRGNPFRHPNYPQADRPRANQQEPDYAEIRARTLQLLYPNSIQPYRISPDDRNGISRVMGLEISNPSVLSPTQQWTATQSTQPPQTSGVLYMNQNEAMAPSPTNSIPTIQPATAQNCRKRYRSPEAYPTLAPTDPPHSRHFHSLETNVSEGPVSQNGRNGVPGDCTYNKSLHFMANGSSIQQPLPDLQLSAPAMPPPEKLPTWEAFDQVIVSNHGDYKWPVFLYKINEKKFGCYAAKLWVEEKLSTLGFDTEYKSSFHTTEGFLKDGDYLTFAVLHNAVDPFRCGDSITTTTFGFCGSSPDELRWKTIMPCLRLKVEKWEAEGSIQQIKLWHPGLPPAERRFHRAYWLAANKRPLGGLLNRAKTDDLPTQVPESSEPEAALIYSDKMNANVLSDTDLEFDDSDVTNDGIDISSEEAAGIWQKCLEELRSDLPSVNHPSTVGLSPSD